MYKVNRSTTLPKSLKNVLFVTYDKAKYAVRKYLKTKGHGNTASLSSNGFSIKKVS